MGALTERVVCGQAGAGGSVALQVPVEPSQRVLVAHDVGQIGFLPVLVHCPNAIGEQARTLLPGCKCRGCPLPGLGDGERSCNCKCRVARKTPAHHQLAPAYGVDHKAEGSGFGKEAGSARCLGHWAAHAEPSEPDFYTRFRLCLPVFSFYLHTQFSYFCSPLDELPLLLRLGLGGHPAPSIAYLLRVLLGVRCT